MTRINLPLTYSPPATRAGKTSTPRPRASPRLGPRPSRNHSDISDARAHRVSTRPQRVWKALPDVDPAVFDRHATLELDSDEGEIFDVIVLQPMGIPHQDGHRKPIATQPDLDDREDGRRENIYLTPTPTLTHHMYTQPIQIPAWPVFTPADSPPTSPAVSPLSPPPTEIESTIGDHHVPWPVPANAVFPPLGMRTASILNSRRHILGDLAPPRVGLPSPGLATPRSTAPVCIGAHNSPRNTARKQLRAAPRNKPIAKPRNGAGVSKPRCTTRMRTPGFTCTFLSTRSSARIIGGTGALDINVDLRDLTPPPRAIVSESLVAEDPEKTRVLYATAARLRKTGAPYPKVPEWWEVGKKVGTVAMFEEGQRERRGGGWGSDLEAEGGVWGV